MMGAMMSGAIFFTASAVATLVIGIFVKGKRSELLELGAISAFLGVCIAFGSLFSMAYSLMGPVPFTLMGGLFFGIAYGCTEASRTNWRRAILGFSITVVCMAIIYFEPSLLNASKYENH